MQRVYASGYEAHLPICSGRAHVGGAHRVNAYDRALPLGDYVHVRELRLNATILQAP